MTRDKSQPEKFKDLARKLEADENEERFNEQLRKVAKKRPKDAKKDDENK